MAFIDGVAGREARSAASIHKSGGQLDEIEKYLCAFCAGDDAGVFSIS
jgi:hypothetical protein